ncbi:MAG: rhodanese [Cytophagaceae bacterium]|nr:rhodanese [Cytophagaceae bacterium]|tara:strand:- start:3700 stop:4188 length:489 start_codon:yes stop_codon:yes gene_type:complete
MNRILIFVFLALSQILQAQDLDQIIDRYNTRSVDYASVEHLVMHRDLYIIIDTRARREFEVSHIPGAIWLGEKPDKENLAANINDKKRPILLYCSLGVRSEDYGERMQRWGYNNIKNLYGGIFAWKDAGYDVVNAHNKKTDSIHVYNRHWGKYLHTGKKVYD